MEERKGVTFRCSKEVRSRKYMMTAFFNEEITAHMIISNIKADINYIELYAGLEKTPSTDRLHMHIWIRSMNALRPATLAGIIRSGWIDVSSARGEVAREYCLKGGNIIADEAEANRTAEFRANQIDKKANAQIEELRHMTLTEYMRKHPGYWIAHTSSILKTKELIDIKNPKIWIGKLKEKNYWIWGEPGTGKTRWAYSIDPTNTMPKNQNKWWSGYGSETTVVIIDDWSPDIKGMANYIKTWGDRYSFTGELKGGHQIIYPGNFLLVITSNYPPDECFTRESDILAIKRRFNIIQIHSENDIFLTTKPKLSILDRDTN